MTVGGSTWQKLNAYVDDELSAKEKAAVAEDIAADPELARGVAVLQALKAELAEFPQNKTAKGTRPGGGPMPSSLPRWLSAACVAFLLVGAAFFAERLFQPGQDPLLAQHMAWAQTEPPVNVAAPDAGVVSAFFGSQLPSLEPFGLRLNTVNLTALHSGEEVLHAGYIGRRGCRVSLFLLPAGTEASRLDGLEGLLHAEGEVGRWTYHLLAQDMNAARFALIARALEEQLRLLAPLAEDSRLAYRADPAARAPCLT